MQQTFWFDFEETQFSIFVPGSELYSTSSKAVYYYILNTLSKIYDKDVFVVVPIG
jgi:hypothetical protein